MEVKSETFGFIELTTRAHDASTRAPEFGVEVYNSGDVVYSAPKYDAS